MVAESEAGTAAAGTRRWREPAAVREEALRISGELGVAADVVRDHLDGLPDDYAAVTGPRDVVRHANMAATPLQPAEVRTRVVSNDDEGDDPLPEHERLHAVALQRNDLLRNIAGVLTLHGGSVRAAEVFIRDDQVSVESFVIRRPTSALGSWWIAVDGDLHEAVAGRLALSARVASELAERPGPTLRGEPTIAISQEERSASTRVELRTPDRPGLLFHVASLFTEMRLSVVGGVDTVGDDAVDVFWLRTDEGEPLDGHLEDELRLGLRHAIG